jgi:hypothetical protein
MVQRMLSVPVKKQRLVMQQEYPIELDDDLRELKFYGIEAGSFVISVTLIND